MKKAKLSTKDILHLAKLSNLKLTSQEIKKMESQLVETLDYVQNLSEINTTKVSPTNHTVNLTNEYFEDGIKNIRGLSEQQVFQNTKVKKGKYFSVKKVL